MLFNIKKGREKKRNKKPNEIRHAHIEFTRTKQSKYIQITDNVEREKMIMGRYVLYENANTY